jgi:hypothetical protein
MTVCAMGVAMAPDEVVSRTPRSSSPPKKELSTPAEKLWNQRSCLQRTSSRM